MKNTGNRAGKEVVLLFTSDLFASITPDMKRLRRFVKINLGPGETKTQKFEFSDKDLAFVNTKNEWITEPGEFEISIAGIKKKITYK